MGVNPRSWFSRKTLRKDAVAGLILGVEAVPDGLAAGLLAGVNPLAGLYAYLFGMLGAAAFTSSAFMAVQATSAMAIVVSDVGLERTPDPDRALSDGAQSLAPDHFDELMAQVLHIAHALGRTLVPGLEHGVVTTG